MPTGTIGAPVIKAKRTAPVFAFLSFVIAKLVFPSRKAITLLPFSMIF